MKTTGPRAHTMRNFRYSRSDTNAARDDSAPLDVVVETF